MANSDMKNRYNSEWRKEAREQLKCPNCGKHSPVFYYCNDCREKKRMDAKISKRRRKENAQLARR